MNRRCIKERVQEILDNTYLKIVETGNVIEVFVPTKNGWKKELVIGDNGFNVDDLNEI